MSINPFDEKAVQKSESIEEEKSPVGNAYRGEGWTLGVRS